MSGVGPSGQGNFFERLLSDLVGMMGSAGSSSGPRLEMARTFAHNVASGSTAEPNVDPSERIRLEELARIAELHVGEVSGLSVAPGGSTPEILAVGPGTWAWNTVEDWQFLLTAMTEEPAVGTGATAESGSGGSGNDLTGLGGLGALSGLGGFGSDDLESSGEFGDGAEEDLLRRVMATMGPMLSAMKLGSAVGHLARTTMGTYELPIPRPTSSRLLLIPTNIGKFADDWGLAPDEVRLWVLVRELTVNAVLARPHIADRLRLLLEKFLRGSTQDISGLSGLFGGIDPSDPESFRGIFENPEALLDIEPSPEQARTTRELGALTSPLSGFVDYVADEVGSRLLGDRSVLTEAWRRNQVDTRASISSTEAFLGLDMSAGENDRGSSFVKGVLERAGNEGLARLWESAETLPTPPEVDAPGLWLERLAIQDADSAGPDPSDSSEPSPS